MRLPGVCNGDDSTVVCAHLNRIRFGKGMGFKSLFVAYACHSCHAVLDGGARPDWLTGQDVYLAHLEGVLETITRLMGKCLAVFK